jgi:molybdate-binding protein
MDTERYDLVIPTDTLATPLLEPLLMVLHEPEFKRAVESLDGYDASVMGETISITQP